MQRIKHVISAATTPSWLNSVPHNFGDPAAGTIKADEWRSLSTIYLPIALISLWGADSVHPSPARAARLRQVLDHTMLLVAVVILACKHTMTLQRSQNYLENLTQYLERLTEIHPDARHLPNHHMAMHLPHFFSLFGPGRCWWTFPFERIIGSIQRMLSNHKIGEFSSTLQEKYVLICDL